MGCSNKALAFLCVIHLLGSLISVLGDEETHIYNEGEAVILWVNRIGPYHNPQETYSYFSLPFCKAGDAVGGVEEEKDIGFGEVLEGNELVHSGIDIRYLKDVELATLCSLDLNGEKIEAFKYAILNHYWYQLYLDDLPIWGMVGEVVTNPTFEASAVHQILMYTHKRFSIGYNGNQVIEVNLTSENPETLERNKRLDFTYSVRFVPLDRDFDSRFDRYLDYNFFEHQIHWFSIFNSFMMVIFLTGLVALIMMRTLRNDYAKYTKDGDAFDAMERDLGDEAGWKQVHADVFRSPPHLVSLAALIGTGAQLVLLGFCMILLAVAGSMYATRGNIITAFVICYALTSIVAGFTGGSYYLRCQGPHWKHSMVLTGAFFPGICFVIAFFLNLIAIAYGSLAVIPFKTVFTLVFLWVFIALPLTVAGTFLSRKLGGKPTLPCRVNPFPRPIPDKKWYIKPWTIIPLGGLLPFGSIFIEMYFVFSSFWNYKFYYVYGFMLLVFVILIIVTVCVTIVGTYFLLNAEDYRYPWTSFLSSSSTSIYVYIYSIYYFFYKTKMSGFFQTCFYFGYMAMFSAGLGIMCGSIGFFGATIFVHRIYRNIKSD